MSGNGEVIKSFLVGLGFDVDESSLAAFNKSIQTAALRVTALYGAINAFAGSMIYAFSKISEGFEEMGYQYHIIAPAINKAIVLRNELLKAYSAAGINIRKVIVDSINLNMSLTKTKYAMEAIYKSVGSKFFGALQKQSDSFRKKLYENMPYIIKTLEKLVGTVFKAFDAITRLGERLWSILSRIYDFFVLLDKETNGWSTIILEVVAAWQLLNLEFLATPLGMLITGFVALLALFDDFKTWQEGGKSLFDWTNFIPVIDGVTQAIQILKNALTGVVDTLGNLYVAFADLTKGNFKSFFSDIGDAIDSVKGIFGGGAAINAATIGQPLVNPIGSSSANTQNTTNAKMQTSINITGSPNADATAQAVGKQQQNVNRDFVRNLKGATR